MAERQWLVLHELESIKVACDKYRLPGVPKVKLQMGTSLCKLCFCVSNRLVMKFSNLNINRIKFLSIIY